MGIVLLIVLICCGFWAAVKLWAGVYLMIGAAFASVPLIVVLFGMFLLIPLFCIGVLFCFMKIEKWIDAPKPAA